MQKLCTYPGTERTVVAESRPPKNQVLSSVLLRDICSDKIPFGGNKLDLKQFSNAVQRVNSQETQKDFGQLYGGLQVELSDGVTLYINVSASK